MRTIPRPLSAPRTLARLALMIGCVFLRALTLPTAALGAVDEPSLDETLYRIRAALGTKALEAHPAGIRLEGRSTQRDQVRRYSLPVTPRGQFLRRIEGVLTEIVSFVG